MQTGQQTSLGRQMVQGQRRFLVTVSLRSRASPARSREGPARCGPWPCLGVSRDCPLIRADHRARSMHL